MDEERDEDAGGNRERGQDDADGGQDSLVEAGLKTGFHGVHTRVGLLEAELHGEEQAIEGAVVLVLGDEAVNRLIDLSRDLSGGAGRSAGSTEHAGPTGDADCHAGSLPIFRRATQGLVKEMGSRRPRPAPPRLSDVSDEERDEDARGDRERGQGDPEGGQDSLVEAGLEPGFHGIHAGVDLREAGVHLLKVRVHLLEAKLHGVEQALEGAVVLVLGDKGVDGLIDLSGDLGGGAGGSAGSPEHAGPTRDADRHAESLPKVRTAMQELVEEVAGRVGVLRRGGYPR